MGSRLEEAFRQAEHAADRAVSAAMEKYAYGHVTDEDDITGVLIGRLDAAFDESIGGVNWSSSVLRHRKGVAAQEKKAGADMLMHVSIKTPQITYSKGVRIQGTGLHPDTPSQKEEHPKMPLHGVFAQQVLGFFHLSLQEPLTDL